MISRHVDQSHSTRVPPEVGDAAKDLLKERGWTVFSFLNACLHALVDKPDKVLALVGKYRTEKPKGRPRRADPPVQE